MIRDTVGDWQELSELYEQADALEGDALAAWLQSPARAGHRLMPQLRRMLAAKTDAERAHFLDALPAWADADDRVVAAWREGSRLGPWRLVRPLGAGGMAEVWLADRADGAFARQVAVKLLYNHPTRAQRETFAERFRRERDILASLRHPNIAALHDAGVTPDGQPWLALEYVEGLPITTWCDARVLTIADRVDLFRQVLTAVESAHANLVIHRDLKPSNILVTGEREVRLLDFGIAKLLDEPQQGVDETELTRNLGRPLTFAYASPEQILGRPLTTASDVYSLGATLFELVTGRVAFGDGRGGRLASPEDVAERDPGVPSKAAAAGGESAARVRGMSAAALRTAIDRDLDAVILRCLDRADMPRYRTVEALRLDLERWLAGHPVQARVPGVLHRARKFVGRHRVAVAVATAAVATLLATTAAAVATSIEAKRQEARAVASRGFLLDTILEGDPDRAGAQGLSVRQLLRSARQRAGQVFATQPDLQGDLLASIGNVQAWLGDDAEGATALAEAERLYRSADRRREAASTGVARTEILLGMGDARGAAAAIAQARRDARSLEGDFALQAQLWDAQGYVEWYEDRFEAAAEAFEQALIAARRDGTGDAGRRVTILLGLAEVRSEMRRFDAAEAHLVEGEALASTLGPSYGAVAALTAARIGVRKGDLAVAQMGLARALPTCEARLGAGHDACVQLRIEHTLLLVRTGQPARAMSMLEQLRLDAVASGSPRRRVAATVTALRVATANRRGDEVADLSRRAVDIGSSASDASVDEDARILALMAAAEAALHADRADDATALVARVRRSVDATSRPSLALNLRARAFLLEGSLEQATGAHERALRSFASAGRELEARYGESHPFVRSTSANAIASLCALGRHDEAAHVDREVDPTSSPTSHACDKARAPFRF